MVRSTSSSKRRDARGADDGRDAGDGLEAAEAAAVAFDAVGVDDDVADLAGAVAVAAEQLVAEDEAGADAAADLDDDEVLRPLVAAEQVGREGGRAAVVGDDRGEAVALARGSGRAAGPASRG